ncbi:MAG: SRPBCC domain-containing protein [Spirochaetales bacterium]
MHVDNQIAREVILPTAPSRVWRALTKPEQLGQWLAPVIRIEPVTDGEFFCAWPNHGKESEGRIVNVQSGVRLEFTWRHTQPDTPTTVVFSLSRHMRGTLLSVREAGFDSLAATDRDRAIAEGELTWDEALCELRRYLQEDREDAHETER